MGVEDGMLLFASVVKPRLYLWSMEAGPRGAAGRAQSRFIELGPLLPRPVLVDNTEVSAVGFAEGVGVIFIKTKVGLYTIHLKSKQSNQVHRGYINKVMPYMSFYTGGV
uniref:CNH domain-containing protein n=1 Tax=Aegilops tauschii subsp. strangulata TaxID=200361 RepID=A0A453IV36_AEGTS